MCDLENQVVFQTLISNHLEIVELPINKEDLNLMRSLIEQISSLNNMCIRINSRRGELTQ
jgi:hypothetical protein